MKSIKDIKAEFLSCSEDELDGFIAEYGRDIRTGAQALCRKAKKQKELYEKEKNRMYEMYSYERKFVTKQLIGGVDEVGRGPLAGPVVACTLILPKDCDTLYIDDSKKLSAKKRDELYDILTNTAVCFGIGEESHEVVDEVNILQATYRAMKKAIDSMEIKPDQLLCDAVRIPGVDIPQCAIIKGDQKSASIAAASIVAKVTRDRIMDEYDKLYPEYGFASNKGYGTAEHIAALKKYGPCPIHRLKFIQNFI